MAPTNAHMYTKISLYVDTVWFTVQSTTQQFLSYCELLTAIVAYTIQPISPHFYRHNSYLCTF